MMHRRSFLGLSVAAPALLPQVIAEAAGARAETLPEDGRRFPHLEVEGSHREIGYQPCWI